MLQGAVQEAGVEMVPHGVGGAPVPVQVPAWQVAGASPVCGGLQEVPLATVQEEEVLPEQLPALLQTGVEALPWQLVPLCTQEPWLPQVVEEPGKFKLAGFQNGGGPAMQVLLAAQTPLPTVSV